MRSDRFFLRSITIFAILSLIVFAPGTVAAAQVEKVLHSFGNRNGDGYGPAANLIFNKGNLYGTTEFSIVGNGSVFELTPTPGGGWTETILHIFDNENTDGAEPLGALVFDASGDLYGTTSASGAYGGGTVFELAPQTGGGWREVVIHTFKNNGVDGSGPLAGLTIDASGNLYGTTVGGGTYGYGVVFELVPRGNGRWTEAILHSFNYNGVDGIYPHGGLIFDASGNLYGTTYQGGPYGTGSVFELLHTARGGWDEHILYGFGAQYGAIDGSAPSAGVIFDTSGNLYGTTLGGGSTGNGVVFELTPQAVGRWSERVLHNFIYNGATVDGSTPLAGVVLDSSGNLYGTTLNGGAYFYGAVFELTPQGGGGWTETILHSFNFNSVDGVSPYSGVILDASRNLFGTTWSGGVGLASGTVFEITP